MCYRNMNDNTAKIIIIPRLILSLIDYLGLLLGPSFIETM